MIQMFLEKLKTVIFGNFILWTFHYFLEKNQKMYDVKLKNHYVQTQFSTINWLGIPFLF